MYSNPALSIFLSIILIPCFLFAQPCSSVSGQTVAFTLSPGAKAAWNSTLTPNRLQVFGAKVGFSFSAYQLSNGRIAFKTSNPGNENPSKISLYSVDGRKIGSITIDGQTKPEFNKQVVPGVYFARLEKNGSIVRTSRFLVGK
jgi:hypothetical protein